MPQVTRRSSRLKSATSIRGIRPVGHADASAKRTPPRLEPTLDALITFALAEATWAERAIHPTMSSILRRHHERHIFMHLTIARRLEELKEGGARLSPAAAK